MHEAAGLYHSRSADDLEEVPLDDSHLLMASLKLRQVGIFSLKVFESKLMPL